MGTNSFLNFTTERILVVSVSDWLHEGTDESSFHLAVKAVRRGIAILSRSEKMLYSASSFFYFFAFCVFAWYKSVYLACSCRIMHATFPISY